MPLKLYTVGPTGMRRMEEMGLVTIFNCFYKVTSIFYNATFIDNKTSFAQ